MLHISKMDMKRIVGIFLIVSLILYFSVGMSYWQQKPVERFWPQTDPHFIPEPNAYVPFETPPDPRYVFVKEIGIYLLPYQYLNFELPYHRWMFYTFPTFYSPYMYNDVYGANYAFDRYGDAPPNPGFDGPVYVRDVAPSLPIDTSVYPTSQTGFAGGWSSLRFTGKYAADPHDLGGLNDVGLESSMSLNPYGQSRSTKEHFESVDNAHTVSPTAARVEDMTFPELGLYEGNFPPYVQVPTVDYGVIGNGHPNTAPLGTPRVYSHSESEVYIPTNAAFMPDMTLIRDGNKIDLKIRHDNLRAPLIPYTDDLYQASAQFVDDANASYQDSPDKAPKNFLWSVFDYADQKTTADPSQLYPGPYANLSNNVEHFDSVTNPVSELDTRGGNNILKLYPTQAEREATINQFNHGKYRPIGSDRLGRGFGVVSGRPQRQAAYAAKWDVGQVKFE